MKHNPDIKWYVMGGTAIIISCIIASVYMNNADIALAVLSPIGLLVFFYMLIKSAP